MRGGPRGSKVANETPIATHATDKIKDLKGVYLDGITSRTNDKIKSHKV
jgi:hypothetical protein